MMHLYTNITFHCHSLQPLGSNTDQKFQQSTVHTSSNTIMVMANTICNNVVTWQTQILYIPPTALVGGEGPQWPTHSLTHSLTHIHRNIQHISTTDLNETMHKTRNNLVPEPNVRNLHSPWHSRRNDTLNTNFTNQYIYIYIYIVRLTTGQHTTRPHFRLP
jgi:hypothetical protein